MAFEPFETPFSSVKDLGCRNLFWGERCILDLFEYQQSGPDEDVEIGGEIVSGSHMIGLTESSRLWRLTFERPFAVRIRDQSLRLSQSQKLDLPSPYCFAEDSDWLRELIVEPLPGGLIPTHYIFALLDDTIEIVADDSPTIEEIENDLA